VGTFGQTVRAQSPQALVWPAAADVAYVRGSLANVSSYATTEVGSLLASSALGIAGDTPGAGAGVYYLVRPLACGSWQTTLGAEPARDAALP
jgi:hypothetical protein